MIDRKSDLLLSSLLTQNAKRYKISQVPGETNNKMSAGTSKKLKTYHFHTEWEGESFFVMSHSKVICLICKASVALPKKGNVERHYRSVHKAYDSDFPPSSELRKRKVMYYCYTNIIS